VRYVIAGGPKEVFFPKRAGAIVESKKMIATVRPSKESNAALK
jgi:hypothetical protein